MMENLNLGILAMFSLYALLVVGVVVWAIRTIAEADLLAKVGELIKTLIRFLGK